MPARPHRILLATTNPGKVRELRLLLDPRIWECLTPADVGLGGLRVTEDGDSYQANAAQKARALADAGGLPTLADDSGIEVDALGGGPGIHSARYAGIDSTEADNRAKLLAALRGLPTAGRGARYRAVVAIARPLDPAVGFAEGIVEGRIAEDEGGSGGFGYDPIFELPDGRRMAALSAEEKNRVSHRARAVRAAAPLLAALAERLDRQDDHRSGEPSPSE